MLLDKDGLDKRWKKGVRSDYQGELGWHAVGDVETYAPLIFRRVNSGTQGNLRELDLGGRVLANEIDRVHFKDKNSDEFYEDIDLEEQNRNRNFLKVLHMSNKKFRDNLVISFHKRWAKGDIVWPSRTGVMAP